MELSSPNQESWQQVAVGSLASFSSGAPIRVSALGPQSNSYPIPVYGGNGISGYTDRALVDSATIAIGRVGQRCGAVYLTDRPSWITDNALYPTRVSSQVDLAFFALSLEAARLNESRLQNDLPLITQAVLHRTQIRLPNSLHEQRAIVQALSDVDALIAALGALIAKKRAVKNAAMQQLLTDRQRLPGFSGERKNLRLGNVAALMKGKGLSKSAVSPSGARPCLLYGELFTTYGQVVRKVVSRTDSNEGLPSRAGDVLMPGSTTTSGIDLATASALLVDDVALGGDIIVIRQTGKVYNAEFLASYLTHVKCREIADMAQGITIIHLYGRNLAGLDLALPCAEEQRAIAAVLADMDAEIAALEARRDKTRHIKTGMMQELLTGRTRLIPQPAE